MDLKMKSGYLLAFIKDHQQNTVYVYIYIHIYIYKINLKPDNGTKFLNGYYFKNLIKFNSWFKGNSTSIHLI